MSRVSRNQYGWPRLSRLPKWVRFYTTEYQQPWIHPVSAEPPGEASGDPDGLDTTHTSGSLSQTSIQSLSLSERERCLIPALTAILSLTWQQL